MLAQHYNGFVCPGCSVTTDWRGWGELSPLALLLSRLTAPPGTIHCRRGRSQDLLARRPRDREGLAGLCGGTTGKHKTDVVTAKPKAFLSSSRWP